MKHGCLGCVALLLLACSSSGELPREGETPENGDGAGAGGAASGGNGAGGSDGSTPPSADATVVAPRLTSATRDRVAPEIERARAQTTDELLASYPVEFSGSLGYDPLEADGLDLIQASTVGMNDAERARYAANGFVILPRVRYPSMPYGYLDVYAADLPVFVSADMVLEAVHRSFDGVLKWFEREVAIRRLRAMLDSMRARLRDGAHTLSSQAAEDADLYLTVAYSLLQQRFQLPATTTLDAARVEDILARVNAASGELGIPLFGTTRLVDFSQFEVRGHYTDSEDLASYFRAMMWLGRMDFRLLETQDDGSRVFRRRQLEAALALRSLMDGPALADWSAVDRAIGAFVGEHDYMIVPELDQLLADVGSSLATGIGGISDEVLAQAIVDGQYGEQRILSQIVIKNPASPRQLPLDASFAFLGQRYTVDSHVFSNVVYDRVDRRVVPDPLDAAFAALANDAALPLLSPQLEEYPYAGALSGMRTLIDAQPEEYWQSSMYTSWLAVLRTLSPSASAARPSADGLPAVARSEAWSRRLLSTQLASWAELRHDTILYAKQSYTSGSVCEFPDAYVEPYPEFFFAIARYAERGRTLVADLDRDSAIESAGFVSTYFENTARIATLLGEMAEAQRTGMPHSPEQIAFINQAIRIEGGGSGPPLHTGWYKDLYLDPSGALDLDPTIADVHTDPGGDNPPRQASVLHVGTGYPRPIIVSVDTCVGPRAYAGVVSSYHEHLEPGLSRLDDEEWLQERLNDAQEVPWLAPVLGGANTGEPVRYPLSPPDPSAPL
ncbi:MAG: DUF3160 domain-containing protein [Polyangiaceae bacterium]